MCITPRVDLSNLSSNDYVNKTLEWSFINSWSYIESLTASSDPNMLRVFHLNIRGLVNKQDELHKLLLNSNVDIVLLCEAWLNSYNVGRIDLPNYKFVYKNRSSKKGDGVGILIKDQLKHRVLDIDSSIENVFIELKTDSDSLCLGSCYRPPNTDVPQFLLDYHKLLSNVKSITKCHLLIGLDHNLDLLKSDRYKPANEFLELNYDSELLPIINRPTRVTTSSATLIDNIFLSRRLVREAELHVLIDDISDHFPCSVTLSGFEKSVNPVYIKRRKFTEKAVDSIKEDIAKTDWYQKLQPLNTNDGFNLFHKHLTDSLDKHAHEKECACTKAKKHLPWFSLGIKKLHKTKAALQEVSNKKRYHQQKYLQGIQNYVQQGQEG